MEDGHKALEVGHAHPCTEILDLGDLQDAEGGQVGHRALDGGQVQRYVLYCLLLLLATTYKRKNNGKVYAMHKKRRFAG